MFLIVSPYISSEVRCVQQKQKKQKQKQRQKQQQRQKQKQQQQQHFIPHIRYSEFETFVNKPNYKTH